MSDRYTLKLMDIAGGYERWSCRPLEENRFSRAFNSLAVSPDGRLAVIGMAGGKGQSAHLWGMYTGKHIGGVKGHLSQVNAVAFFPDGRTLATGSADTTVLIWDVLAVTSRKPTTDRLAPEALQRAWTDLEGLDAQKAYRAIGVLAGAPEQSLPLL